MTAHSPCNLSRLRRLGVLLAALLSVSVASVAAEAHAPSAPWNENGRIGHQQLLDKARAGKIDLYFLGDSITRRWGATDYPDFLAHWNKNFHGWNAADFGWGGDTTHQMLWRLQNGELDGVNPKVIVLLAGTNNIGKGDKPGSAADAAEGIEAILAFCQAKAPAATIILTAVFPRNDSPASNALITELNTRIARLAEGKRIRFLDINRQLADENGVLLAGMAVDKLHLTLKGYEVWARGLEPILLELLGPRAATDLAPPPTGDPSAAKKP
jgi:lysophospholipase L1-like esterase